MKKLSIKKSLFTILVSSALNAWAANEKIGGGGLPLPPIFDSANKSQLIEAGRNLQPTNKSLEQLATKFQNGDILFIRSTSAQSKALEEVTGSTWTHVGILFRIKSDRGTPVLLPANSKEGKWAVFEAGPKVRFNPVERFVGQKAFATLRLKEGINAAQEKLLFSSALTRLGKPYDIYFLLSNDGETKDEPDYCSELVWYVYQKALGIPLGYRVKIASQKLDGPEAQKLMKERLSRASAPMPVAKWKEQYVIPPEAQILSPLLKRIDL